MQPEKLRPSTAGHASGVATASPWAAAVGGLALSLVLLWEFRAFRHAETWLQVLGVGLVSAPLAWGMRRAVLPWIERRYGRDGEPRLSWRWGLGCAALGGLLLAVFPLRATLVVGVAQWVVLTLAMLAAAPRLIRGPRGPVTAPARWEGFGHALLPCVVWFGWLWIFSPGVLSADSSDQWGQAGLGRFYDFHPVVHTAAIRLLRGIWDSPAIVAVTQILLIATLVGWGLRELRLSGLSRRGAWVSATLLAVLPVFSTMAITLWKDIPFGAMLFGLTVALFRVAAGRRMTLAHWGLVVMLAGLASVLRHNGAPVLLGLVFGLLFLLPKGQRWKSAVIGLSALLLGLGLRQAVVRVYPVSSFTPEIALIGVLGSHIAHGTPLSDAERAVLEDVHPLESKWAYDCFTNVPTVWGSGKFDWDALTRHAPELRRIAVDLSLRDPWPVITHVRCASAMIWEIHPRDNRLTGIGFNLHPDGSLSTIVQGLGTPASSLPIPDLTLAMAKGVVSSLDARVSWIIWRPAFYGWLLLLGCLVACLRSRSWRLMAVLLPVLVHTGALMLVITAPDVRYQYGVLLATAVLGVGFFGGVRVPGARTGGASSSLEESTDGSQQSGIASTAHPAGHQVA